jgi:phosphatidylglycerol lysyltransferase
VRAIAVDGAAYVTLGLSPLSERGKPQVEVPAWLALVLKWVRVHGRRFYNFGGLDAFKAKFNPEGWEPIYAIADSPSFPPGALYAIAGAFSGGAPVALVVKAFARAARQEIRALRKTMRAERGRPSTERRRQQP